MNSDSRSTGEGPRLNGRIPTAPASTLRSSPRPGGFAGLIFSGVAAVNTQWGRAWADLQLPLSTDEPASLMTPQRVAECLAASGDQPAYVGAKVKAPAGADVETRLGIISAVAHLLNS